MVRSQFDPSYSNPDRQAPSRSSFTGPHDETAAWGAQAAQVHREKPDGCGRFDLAMIDPVLLQQSLPLAPGFSAQAPHTLATRRPLLPKAPILSKAPIKPFVRSAPKPVQSRGRLTKRERQPAKPPLLSVKDTVAMAAIAKREAGEEAQISKFIELSGGTIGPTAIKNGPLAPTCSRHYIGVLLTSYKLKN